MYGYRVYFAYVLRISCVFSPACSFLFVVVSTRYLKCLCMRSPKKFIFIFQLYSERRVWVWVNIWICYLHSPHIFLLRCCSLFWNSLWFCEQKKYFVLNISMLLLVKKLSRKIVKREKLRKTQPSEYTYISTHI